MTAPNNKTVNIWLPQLYITVRKIIIKFRSKYCFIDNRCIKQNTLCSYEIWNDVKEIINWD